MNQWLAPGDVASHEVHPGDAHVVLERVPGVAEAFELLAATPRASASPRSSGWSPPGTVTSTTPTLARRARRRSRSNRRRAVCTISVAAVEVVGDVALERQVPDRVGLGRDVPELAGQLQFLTVVTEGVLPTPVPVRDPAGGAQRGESSRRRRVRAGHREGALGELGALDEPSVLLPEPPHRRHEPERQLGLAASRSSSGSRRADVGVVDGQAIEPARLVRPGHVRRGGLGQREIGERMSRRAAVLPALRP